MRRVALSLCCLLALASPAAADGKYYAGPAYEEVPDIPMQRALLVFRGGVETLVLESAVASEAQQLGWVVPLPAVPTRMEAVEPGLLESLAFCFGPEIVQLPWNPVTPAWMLFLFVLAVALAILSRGPLVARLLLYGIPLLAGYTILVPAHMKSGAPGPSPGVEVAIYARVGSYEAQVLEAREAGALERWLTGNGFAGFDGAEREAVSEYIAAGWCFFAAKLVREAGGESLPHPVALTFAAPAPVYPLRLTGLSGASPAFDIFVAAAQGASFPGLAVAFRDTLERRGEGWRSEATRCSIGHPDASPLLWPGCVLTRLRGTLSPAQMGADVTLTLAVTDAPHRDSFFSPRSADDLAACAFFLLGAAGLVVACALRWRALRAKAPLRVLAAMLVSVAVAGAAAGIIRALLPTVEVRVDYAEFDEQHLEWALEDLAAGAPELRRDAPALRQALQERLGELENPFVGGRVRHEASPGNYLVRERDGAVEVLYFDRTATPVPVP
jgi:hypothetical protein